MLIRCVRHANRRRPMLLTIAVPYAAAVLAQPQPATAVAVPPINLDSLLKEMLDRDALARYPDPPYTCKQSSSYDRASTTPDNPKTWFANGDSGHFIRT